MTNQFVILGGNDCSRYMIFGLLVLRIGIFNSHINRWSKIRFALRFNENDVLEEELGAKTKFIIE